MGAKPTAISSKIIVTVEIEVPPPPIVPPPAVSPVNSAPIFISTIPKELVVVAYEDPSSENLKYCLPGLEDFEKDTIIIDNLKFLGPIS